MPTGTSRHTAPAVISLHPRTWHCSLSPHCRTGSLLSGHACTPNASNCCRQHHSCCGCPKIAQVLSWPLCNATVLSSQHRNTAGHCLRTGTAPLQLHPLVCALVIINELPAGCSVSRQAYSMSALVVRLQAHKLSCTALTMRSILLGAYCLLNFGSMLVKPSNLSAGNTRAGLASC